MRPPQITILPSCISFFFGMVLVTISCTPLQTSANSSSGTVPTRSNPFHLFVLPLYNHKGFDLGEPEWLNSFLYFNLSLNFAIRSSWSKPQWAPGLVFCWLYRASPSSAAKNIISLFSLLTLWWCPCVQSSLVLMDEGVCYDQCSVFSCQNSVSLCPASFCTPRPNLPVTPGVSWLLHSSPIWWKGQLYWC